MRAFLALFVLAAVLPAQDREKEDLRRALEDLARRFEVYKAERDREVAELQARLLEQNARAAEAVARLRSQNAEVQAMRERVEAALKLHESQSATIETLQAEVKGANEVNAENKRWLDRVAAEAQEAQRLAERATAALSRGERELSTQHLVKVVLPANVDALRPALAAGRVVDGWGNPIVLLESALYEVGVETRTGAGRTIRVRGVRKADGTFYSPGSYQLISLGANGRQDAPGTEEWDDLVSFDP